MDDDDYLTALVTATQRTSEIKTALRRLRDIEAWALAGLPVHAGDAVVITDEFPASIDRSSGWYVDREHLVPGATGTVQRVDFSPFSQRWYADYVPDVEWRVSSMFDKRFPADHPHIFMFPLRYLRLRTDEDVPLTMPT